MQAVLQALGRAAWSQLHPRMLLALLLPFVVMLIALLLLVWVFWTPLNELLGQWLLALGWVEQIDAWLVGLGVASLVVWFVPLIAIGVLAPMAGVVGLLIGGLVIMPWALSHLSRTHYPGLDLRGEWATSRSVWNATWVVLSFCGLWLITLPLWLLPPLALILPLLLWAFAFRKMLSVDALVEHASSDELQRIQHTHARGWWLLGLSCAVLSLIPPAWLFMPTYSALLFAHFGLARLQELRASSELNGNRS